MMIQNNYLYLLICLYLFLLWLIPFLARPDFRRKMIKCGIVGSIVAATSEFWFLADYWRPPTILGHLTIIEDILYGFFIVGIAVSIYGLIFNQKDSERVGKRKNNILIPSLALAYISLYLFSTVLRYNSIIVNSVFCIGLGLIYSLIRRDLFLPGLFTGLFFAFMIIPLYLVLKIIYPGIFTSYWLLSGTRLGTLAPGGIPYTEFLWHFSWGFL